MRSQRDNARGRSARLGGATLVAILTVTACSSSIQDLPDDEQLDSCLSDISGQGVDSLATQAQRKVTLADPAALDCVAQLESSADQQAVLQGVYDDEELRPVLLDWIATQGGLDSDALAARTGTLLGAAGGDDDDFAETYDQDQLTENLAYAVYVAAQGEPASYATWLEDEEAQRSVSQSDPLAPTSQYVAWLSDPANGDQATGEAIRVVADRIDESRAAVS